MPDREILGPVSTRCVFSAAVPIFNTNLMKFIVYSAQHPRRKTALSVHLSIPLRSQRSQLKSGTALRLSMSLVSCRPIKMEKGAEHTISTMAEEKLMLAVSALKMRLWALRPLKTHLVDPAPYIVLIIPIYQKL